MSQFTDDLVVKNIGDRLWELYSPFTYFVGDKEGYPIEVPKGFKTDFASVPRIAWVICPPDGKYTGAAVVHDYLYSRNGRFYTPNGKLDQDYSRKDCDKIFLEAMGVLGVPLWKRKIMYRAVRMFGWSGWNRAKKALEIIKEN